MACMMLIFEVPSTEGDEAVIGKRRHLFSSGLATLRSRLPLTTHDFCVGSDSTALYVEFLSNLQQQNVLVVEGGSIAAIQTLPLTRL